MSDLGPVRHDYRFPLRINSSQRQAERSSYPDHVAQMIKQFLLTAPGERVNLPDFGGGTRRLIFAPKTTGLISTSELLIRQGLEKYLGDQIRVVAVRVSEAPLYGDGALEIFVEYQLVETQSSETLTIQVR